MLRRGLMAVGIWCAAGSIPGAAQTPALDADTEARIEALEPQVIAWRHDRIRTIATRVAESMGATAEVTIGRESSYPVTVNDPELTERMGPVLEAMATNGIATNIPETGAEDFAFFANEVPGFYFILGGRPPETRPEQTADHHTPDFFLDESGLIVGVRAMTALTLSYLGTEAATAGGGTTGG